MLIQEPFSLCCEANDVVDVDQKRAAIPLTSVMLGSTVV